MEVLLLFGLGCLAVSGTINAYQFVDDLRKSWNESCDKSRREESFYNDFKKAWYEERNRRN